jgi:hypothetical protein
MLPCLILSTDCGVLIVDQIYLPISESRWLAPCLLILTYLQLVDNPDTYKLCAQTTLHGFLVSLIALSTTEVC